MFIITIHDYDFHEFYLLLLNIVTAAATISIAATIIIESFISIPPHVHLLDLVYLIYYHPLHYLFYWQLLQLLHQQLLLLLLVQIALLLFLSLITPPEN